MRHAGYQFGREKVEFVIRNSDHFNTRVYFERGREQITDLIVGHVDFFQRRSIAAFRNEIFAFERGQFIFR